MAAPQEVYQSYVDAGTGDRVWYRLPLPDGSYTVRLHFASPNTLDYRFDVP